MAFAFNFGGDDIDQDAPQQDTHGVPEHGPSSDSAAAQVPVAEHDLREWLDLLPSQLSYTLIPFPSDHTTTQLPRRALFDIRAQLMAEDDDPTSLLPTLSASDLSTRVYEGGFKTWECSLDLARLLLARGPRRSPDDLARVAHVVELGCGSALPSTALLRHALRANGDLGPKTFTLADYNAHVLRLATVPNLLLTWALCCRDDGADDLAAEGELDVTPALVQGFLRALSDAQVHITLLSGPWGPELLRRVPRSVPGLTTLVLAAETVYSPASTEAFVGVLSGILAEGAANKALVAAKRFYFGVGGSVDALKEACAEKGMVAAEVENAGLPGMDAGVGRAVVEVQIY